MKNKFGFTLLEISIVMIIIGLIIGGILVGKEMINNATLRSQIAQIDKYKTAVTTFRLKYNCMPGDCPNATAYGLSNNGNGDEYLVSVYTNGNWFFCGTCTGTSAQENYYFWQHLDESSLIENSVLACCYNADTQLSLFLQMVPKAKLDVGYVFAGYMPEGPPWSGNPGTPPLGNVFAITNIAPASADSRLGGAMSGSDAYYIDGKIDDGYPTKGRVLNIAYNGNTRRIETDIRGGTCTTYTYPTLSQYVKTCAPQSAGLLIQFKP